MCRYKLTCSCGFEFVFSKDNIPPECPICGSLEFIEEVDD